MTRIPFGVTLESVKGGTDTYDGELPGAYPVRWTKRDGDDILKDEEIASVETDKVMFSITAPVSGRIVSIFPESEWSTTGETVGTPHGAILAPALGEIEVGGSDSLESPVESWENEGGNGNLRMTPLARKIATQKGVDVSRLTGTGPGGRVQASDVEKALPDPGDTVGHTHAVPSARALAREKGINLADVAAHGKDGLVLCEDVRNTVVRKEHQEPFAKETHVSKTPHIRKTIARLLTKSWREIPHGRDEITADVTMLAVFLKMYKTYGEPFSGIPARLEYIVAWYSVCMLQEERFRPINAYWDKEKEEAVHLPEINIGIAVQTERGLMIPVVRNAGAERAFATFATEIAAQIRKAKNGTARLSDVRDLTFTINNTGALGGENPSSILPYAICSDGSERPTSMMVCLPRIRKEKDRSLLSLAMFFDHRPLDGDMPMAFIKELRRRIEEKKAPEDFQTELFTKIF
ncbi:MAG: 2-oxo acid dehydrogenase subunit E2 [Parcubacteria group bacterium]|nr:2-oxo acid dehydrogenase subunit E2 [Parcubacteria group bacterium]